MGKSYEDYITPAKEANVYASNEKSRFEVKNNFKSVQAKEYKSESAETIASDEIKARTERILYDDDTKILSNEKPGTGIPTRETYKMVTPNYYASLPTVAEKYDFNEPLPERDRERERVKYIGNPPARINKKIRL
ncbi:unnamed protein product [Leptosia nina]|uniref:Uncharacterized protein n=1 Tax=Leptosia nina TaxID=320188 RepID=A0AAV1JXX9_9NEOP